MRLKACIKKKYPHFSQKRISAFLRAGRVLVNGRVVRSNPAVSAEDELCLMSENKTALIPNRAVNCHLIKKNGDFIFFAKGPFVHSVAHDYDETGSAANWLLSVDAGLSEVSSPLESGLAHRLDYETSGIMVAARHREALAFLKEALARRQIIKEYVCWVQKKPPRLGVFQAYAGKHPKSDKKVLVKEILRAKMTKIQTEILEIRPKDGIFRLRIRLITGSRHQIRAHLAFLGCPIVGDKVYRGLKAKRLMLHAERLEFLDWTGRKYGVDDAKKSRPWASKREHPFAPWI